MYISPIDNKEFSIEFDKSGVYYSRSGGCIISLQKLKLLLNNEPSQTNHQKEIPNTNLINTEEMYLSNLGYFPLADKDLYLFSDKFNCQINDKKYFIPKLLQDSNIPIFYSTNNNDKEETIIFIPPVAEAVCRYFAQMWDLQLNIPFDNENDIQEIVTGIIIIHSFLDKE